MALRITELRTKGDLYRFAATHMDGPLNWRASAGEGGTIVITEEEDDTG